MATPCAAADFYTGRAGSIAMWISDNLPRAIASLVVDPDKAERTIDVKKRQAAGDRWAGIIFSARPLTK